MGERTDRRGARQAPIATCGTDEHGERVGASNRHLARALAGVRQEVGRRLPEVVVIGFVPDLIVPDAIPVSPKGGDTLLGELLEKAMDQLPDGMRQVLILHDVDFISALARQVLEY